MKYSHYDSDILWAIVDGEKVEGDSKLAWTGARHTGCLAGNTTAVLMPSVGLSLLVF